MFINLLANHPFSFVVAISLFCGVVMLLLQHQMMNITVLTPLTGKLVADIRFYRPNISWKVLGGHAAVMGVLSAMMLGVEPKNPMEAQDMATWQMIFLVVAIIWGVWLIFWLLTFGLRQDLKEAEKRVKEYLRLSRLESFSGEIFAIEAGPPVDKKTFTLRNWEGENEGKRRFVFDLWELGRVKTWHIGRQWLTVRFFPSTEPGNDPVVEHWAFRKKPVLAPKPTAPVKGAETLSAQPA